MRKPSFLCKSVVVEAAEGFVFEAGDVAGDITGEFAEDFADDFAEYFTEDFDGEFLTSR